MSLILESYMQSWHTSNNIQKPTVLEMWNIRFFSETSLGVLGALAHRLQNHNDLVSKMPNFPNCIVV